MNIFDYIFKNTHLTPLTKKNNVELEIHNNKELLVDKGFDIISVSEYNEYSLILYRHFYEDTPKTEEKMIFLGLRIISNRGVHRLDPILKAFFNDDFSSISIADIEIKDHLSNNGFGSILLETLIKIAKNYNVKNISGWISRVDIDHIEKLVHFYRKHQFKVTLYNNDSSALKIGDLEWGNI